MLSASEAQQTMHQYQDKLDEIRTICRLRAYPTGQRENLVDLPFRLSQDSALRADLADIIRSLQRSQVHLPDVLDILVLAVGGESAPQHSRELREPLSLLGGFLLSIGRWPDTDARPVLAPGEVPANLEKFMRPQPPAQASPQVTSPAKESASGARSVRLFEVASNRSQAKARSNPSPAKQGSRSPLAPDQPALSSANQSNPITQGSSLASQPPRPTQQQPSRSPDRLPPDRPDRLPPDRVSQDRPSPDRPSPDRPSPDRLSTDRLSSESPAGPPTDISRALSRLERGNLELRAHLDSIDQRISRMEPLLESGAPADRYTPPFVPEEVTAARDMPTLLHRDPSERKPLRTEDLHADPLLTDPIRTASPRPETIRTTSLWGERRLDADPATQVPVRIKPEPLGPKLAEPLRHPSIHPPLPDSPHKNVAPSPTPLVSRFSRFSREPEAAEPLPSDHLPAAVAPATALNSQLGEPVAATESAVRPATLPRGFFGTIPEPDPAHLAVDPPRNRRRFTLIVTLVILLGLAAAAVFLYMRSQAGDGDQTSGGISPVPAPRPAATSAYPTSGPLSTSPTRSAAGPRAGAATNQGPTSRTAPQPTPVLDDPAPVGGFRPAANFVPASVMEGHLTSAPLPAQARIPAYSGAQAVVVMEVNISNTGQVEDLYVLGGNRALRPAAIDAVRNWRYKPYLLNGTPSEVRTIVRVDFNQHRSEPADRGAPFPQ